MKAHLKSVKSQKPRNDLKQSAQNQAAVTRAREDSSLGQERAVARASPS